MTRTGASPVLRHHSNAYRRSCIRLGDATGVRGAFNKALTGDPRGICLSLCDDWNKVKQTAYAFVSLTTAQGRQDIRVLATMNLETLAPEEVVDQALSRAIAAIEVTGSASVGK